MRETLVERLWRVDELFDYTCGAVKAKTNFTAMRGGLW
jgi:hypothetical protein